MACIIQHAAPANREQTRTKNTVNGALYHCPTSQRRNNSPKPRGRKPPYWTWLISNRYNKRSKHYSCGSARGISPRLPKNGIIKSKRTVRSIPHLQRLGQWKRSSPSLGRPVHTTRKSARRLHGEYLWLAPLRAARIVTCFYSKTMPSSRFGKLFLQIFLCFGNILEHLHLFP